MQIHVCSPSGLFINIWFFSPDEFECDFDPREFVTQQHVDEMCHFISVIGRALGATVNVCTEGASSYPYGPEVALLSYEPAANAVVVRDSATLSPRAARGGPPPVRRGWRDVTVAAVVIGGCAIVAYVAYRFLVSTIAVSDRSEAIPEHLRGPGLVAT